MSLGLIRPQTIHELLADPIYRAYLLKRPRLASDPPEGALPWRVWGERHDDKWAGKLFPTYVDAFELLKKMIKDRDTYRDAVIVCRPQSFGPPAGLVMPRGLSWCGYCRRPTMFRRSSNHHATRKWVAVDPDPTIRRCYYCASRETAHRRWH